MIVGLGGDDHIYGHGGDDVICGGSGHDEIEGGTGADWIFGQGKATSCWAGAATIHQRRRPATTARSTIPSAAGC